MRGKATLLSCHSTNTRCLNPLLHTTVSSNLFLNSSEDPKSFSFKLCPVLHIYQLNAMTPYHPPSLQYLYDSAKSSKDSLAPPLSIVRPTLHFSHVVLLLPYHQSLTVFEYPPAYLYGQLSHIRKQTRAYLDILCL